MNSKGNYKKIVKQLLIIILILCLCIFYFNLQLIITPDGSNYYFYTKIIDGFLPFQSWDITRGFSFPLILSLFKNLFGDSSMGMIIGFFIFHLLLVYLSFLILNMILKTYRKNKNNIVYWILFLLLIMFNPLIIGYSHTLLTEAVMPTFVIITCYMCIKWRDISWVKNKKSFLLYIFLFSIITILVWFLKQPYVVIIFSLIFMSSILCSIYQKSWKVFLEKMVSCMIILIMLVFSILVWNKILIDNNVDFKKNSTNKFFLSSGILSGMQYHFRENFEYCNLDYIQNGKFNEYDKNKILMISENADWCQQIRVIEVVNKGNILDTLVIYDSNNFSVKRAFSFWIKNFVKHPYLILDGYFKNYMNISDFYSYEILPNNTYLAGDKFSFNVEKENSSIGFGVYNNKNLCWWESEPDYVLEYESVQNMSNFNCNYKINDNFHNIMIDYIKPIFLNIFKFSILLSFPLAIYSFIKLIKDKKSLKYYATTIIFGASFIHTFFHAIMGAIIDRYAYITMPLALLGYIILIIPNKQIYKDKSKLLSVISKFINEKILKKFEKN